MTSGEFQHLTKPGSQVTIDQVEESEVNFVELVHTLLESPAEKEHFFQVRRTHTHAHTRTHTHTHTPRSVPGSSHGDA